MSIFIINFFFFIFFRSFVDDSVCLFGTPPRVARRRTLTRRVYNNRVQSIEEESAANEVDMIFGIDEDCDGMDTVSNKYFGLIRILH